MKKELTTEKVYSAYIVLASAKYGKLSEDEKIQVWKIARTLNPIATKFEEDTKNASETFVPYDGFKEDLQRANEYREKSKDRNADADSLPMSPAVYQDFMKKFAEYQEIVGKALKDFAKTKVCVDFEIISEETFKRLLDSNDWTFGQVVAVGYVLCD